MHALIRNDAIVLTGPLPYPTWPDPETGRWWDMRDPEQVAEAGWVEVVIEPRPDNTATTTWERTEPDLVEGVPVIGWTERDKTPEELQAEADRAAAQARRETHEGILDATAALMEDAHEDGAAWVQPLGAHNAYPLGATGHPQWEDVGQPHPRERVGSPASPGGAPPFPRYDVPARPPRRGPPPNVPPANSSPPFPQG